MRVKTLALAAVTALGVFGATGAAQAREPSIWVQCDGLPKPEGAGTTLARVGAVVMTGALLGLPESQREVPAASGKPGVAACTAALADPALGDRWARKASLLRSRAMHHAEAGDLPSALTDLQAIGPATAGRVDDGYFKRSAGVSVQLFQAAVLAHQGRGPEAEALAIQAADARPWSDAVQSLAAAILAVDPAWTAEEDRILTRRAALDPAALGERASAREWGSPEGAADDWAEAADRLTRAKAESEKLENTAPGEAVLETLIRQPRAIGKAGLAAARAGRTEQARARLAELKALKPWTPAPVAKPRRGVAELQARVTELSSKATDLARETYVPVIEAYLLASEGKAADASAALTDKRLPLEPATMDLLRKVKTGSADVGGLAELPTQLRAERLERLNVVDYAKALPILETRPKRSPFTSQGPYGFRSSNGFLDRANKTGGRTIEFSGNLSQPVVEELLLLRAAQLAREAKSPGFAVVEKRDFKRYYVTTMYGAETSRTPSGFESQADIVFVDPARAGGLALNADRVWAELSPFYVYDEAKPAKR